MVSLTSKAEKVERRCKQRQQQTYYVVGVKVFSGYKRAGNLGSMRVNSPELL